MAFKNGAVAEKIDAAMSRIRSNGGQINPKKRIFTMPKGAGIALWGCADCLTNWAGFRLVGKDGLGGYADPALVALGWVSKKETKEDEERAERRRRNARTRDN